MNKLTLLAVMVSATMMSNVSVADVSWAGWNNNIGSDNGHASTALTSENQNILANNVNNVNADLQDHKAKQDAYNAKQDGYNKHQKEINENQTLINQNQGVIAHIN